MPSLCQELHGWANTLSLFRFPFEAQALPLNGLYLLFENGEMAHGANRIVRVGTHTGNNQLRSRLNQHFLVENKDRSIFRKNIGRALLNRDRDPFLSDWELDLTSRKEKELHRGLIDVSQQQLIERRVSEYIQASFRFVVIPVEEKESRLRLESMLISTISLCDGCKQSSEWLGNFSPKQKIRDSGLWLINELYRQPLSREDFNVLQALVQQADHTLSR
jgi:hypothetical protein